MVTIKEIAEQLGVSPTTVSNVVNGRTGKMSAETRERIEEALWQNHYETAGKSVRGTGGENMIAAAFNMGNMSNVLTDPFCGELLGAIQRELKSCGRYMLYDVPETEEELQRLFSPWNIDGGILLGFHPEKCGGIQKKIGKPLVFVDSYFGQEEEFDNIGLQDYEGAFELASYLLKLGHKAIAFFSSQNPPLASNMERFRGFQNALEAYGMSFSKKNFYFLPDDKNMRYECLRQFAKRSAGQYTAAFFLSDYMANEAINVFFSQGLKVPDDISVTGFDDNIYARLSRPPLTTVRQSPADKGKKAVELLMKRIQGEEVHVRTLHLPTELIVRESVKNVWLQNDPFANLQGLSYNDKIE